MINSEYKSDIRPVQKKSISKLVKKHHRNFILKKARAKKMLDRFPKRKQSYKLNPFQKKKAKIIGKNPNIKEHRKQLVIKSQLKQNKGKSEGGKEE